MNPTQILFNSVSGLTGGIVHDLQTAMVAVVTILFVLLGLNVLKRVFLKDSYDDSEQCNKSIFDYDTTDKDNLRYHE